MTAAHCVFIILLCGVLTAYTWGMRGTIVGGERGAMLPGAALALVLLHAGGSLPLAMTFPLAATIGACGMFFGGSMSYGETLALTADEDPSARRHGFIGIALKGGLWFALFGGILALGMLAVAGRFSLLRTILFVLGVTAAYVIGKFFLRFLCNKSKFLKKHLYFSRTRDESWGGLALSCFFLLVFSILHKQVFAPLLSLFGFVCGAAGFSVGNLLRLCMDRKKRSADSGFLRFLSGWKTMECVFGAVGGAGTALGWCVLFRRYVATLTAELISHSGAWRPIREKPGNILVFVYLGCFVLYLCLMVLLKKRKEAAEDLLIWPVFCLFPLFLAMTGNVLGARIASVGMMLFVLAEKFTLSRREKYEKLWFSKAAQCILMLLTALAFAAILFTDRAPSALGTMGLYTLLYYAASLYVVLDPARLSLLRQNHPSFGAALLSIADECGWAMGGGVLAVVSLILSSHCFSI